MDYPVYEQKQRLWFAFVICVLFVAVGLWTAQQPRTAWGGPSELYASAIVFALLAMAALARIARRTPVLVLSDRGIDDRTTAGAGPIAWREMTRVAIGSGMMSRQLVITVTNPGEFISRPGSAKRLWWRATRRLAGSDYRISLVGLAVDPADLVERANRRLAQEAATRSRS